MQPQGFVSPFMLMPQQMFGQPQRDERVPRRVMVAVEMLQHLTHKTMTRVAVNDMAIEEIEGQKLDVEEKHVFVSACNLIVKYIDGEYKPTKDEKAERESSAESHRSIIRCPNCGNSGGVLGRKCNLCDGSGFLSVSPSNPDGTS